MELAKDAALAFGLTHDQLEHVEFFVRYASPKTGAGRQEMHLRGTGEVKLLRTRAFDKPEEVVEGQAPLLAVARLLDITETEGFFAMEDEYPRDRHGGRYTFKITLPGREKQVVVAVELPEHHPPQAFSHVLGALKLTAALGTEEAVHHRFLSTL